jgi:hypothetical protein
MLCHTAKTLLGAAWRCDCATPVWKQRKTQSTAIAAHHEWAHIETTRPVGPTDTPLPSLGVSSLDLGRSPLSGPFLCGGPLPPSLAVPPPSSETPFSSYAAVWLLQCKRIALRFVRRTFRFCLARLVSFSLTSLPSLGVSSLDLGRTVHRAAPFLSGPRKGLASHRHATDAGPTAVV